MPVGSFFPVICATGRCRLAVIAQYRNRAAVKNVVTAKRQPMTDRLNVTVSVVIPCQHDQESSGALSRSSFDKVHMKGNAGHRHGAVQLAWRGPLAPGRPCLWYISKELTLHSGSGDARPLATSCRIAASAHRLGRRGTVRLLVLHRPRPFAGHVAGSCPAMSRPARLLSCTTTPSPQAPLRQGRYGSLTESSSTSGRSAREVAGIQQSKRKPSPPPSAGRCVRTPHCAISRSSAVMASAGAPARAGGRPKRRGNCYCQTALHAAPAAELVRLCRSETPTPRHGQRRPLDNEAIQARRDI